MTSKQLVRSVLRIVGVILCICLLTIGIAWCWPYGGTLVWHLRNRSTARIGEYQVPIPRWVRPDREDPLRFELRHGQYDYIQLELRRNVIAGNKWQNELEANSKSADPKVAEMAKHFLGMKTTRLMIADQPSLCIDYGLSIHCIPDSQERGLNAYFLGSQDAKPVFYETLGRIKRTESK